MKSLLHSLLWRVSRHYRLARFFDIDLNKIKQEKRAMLDELRTAHTKRTA